MEHKNINIGKTTTAIIALLFLCWLPNWANDDVVEPYLELKYLKNHENNKVLTGKLTYYEDKQDIPIVGVDICFYIQDSMVATTQTDMDGEAILLVSPNYPLPNDEEGFTRYLAVFEGNNQYYETSSEEIQVKDAHLELVLEEIDSVKTITVKAYELAGENEKIPISWEDIYIDVPRMFTNLRIAEEYFEEDGIVSIPFPGDLPGDQQGNITIIAKFEDNMTFGNVEARGKTDWGIPSTHNIPPSYRALWTEIAPMWMIVTLTILLAGVWGHYIFTVIQLIFIKKESKRA